MRVFVTGGSGHIGSALVPELVSAGHQVLGLARSSGSATMLEAAGAHVRLGDLTDLDGLAAAAAETDGVVHLAYDHAAMSSGDVVGAAQTDLRAVQAIGAALEGSGKALVVTGGTLLLAFAGVTGRSGTERDVLPGGPRADTENAAIALAERGVRSSVVRLPPLVHSELDRHGFLPTLVRIARETHIAGYVGEGHNRWPAVHTLDAAHLFRLALESAPAGTRLHAVDEGGVEFGKIAAAIGALAGVPTGPVAPEHFSFLAMLAGLDNPVDAGLTRELLGWAPTHTGLLDDIAAGHYAVSEMAH